MLLNLGLLYEDRNDYGRAQACYRRVLETAPNHQVAKMYLKDAIAGGPESIDDEQHKKNEKLAQLLSTPVTEFELSVRSRNCLQKMGIRTLGDLTRVSEQTLLSSKNFGETSWSKSKRCSQAKDSRSDNFPTKREKPNHPWISRA